MDTQGKSVLTAVVCGLVSTIAWVLLTLPANPRVVDRSDPSIGSESVAAGAFHVHTTRSDGGAPVDEVAEAAREAGLQFLIVTDHGDGTRTPEPPQYRSGVLTLDSVEISTSGGHYIAIGLPQTPYPLGGEPDTVVEDVRRFGGFGVIAHPTSPKPDLRWRDPALIVDASSSASVSDSTVPYNVAGPSTIVDADGSASVSDSTSVDTAGVDEMTSNATWTVSTYEGLTYVQEY